MIKRQPVECYSRVVGFFRPIKQWNKGKRAEFEDRKSFDWRKEVAKKVGSIES